MVQFLAILIASIVGYLPHALFGDHLSLTADFLIGSLVGGAAYVAAIYFLKKLRGDF